jgi:hypothetical protein
VIGASWVPFRAVEFNRDEWADFGGLNYNAVTSSQCRRNLFESNQKGMVEWLEWRYHSAKDRRTRAWPHSDLCDHAKWNTLYIVQ